MNAMSQLQQQVIGRLTASVADVPSLTPAAGEIMWVTEDKGDLASIIARQIGKMGIVGIVMTPGGQTCKLYDVGMTVPIAFACPIEIQIQENVTVNRGAAGTQISNLDLVQFCMRRLHQWSPSHQRVNKIELDETPYLLVADAPILVYNVRFNAKLTIQ
jgi:hypothetical protein